ncbi:MAG: hypothetical protein WCK00_11545 [Deltaproteobacteria bacterium]
MGGEALAQLQVKGYAEKYRQYGVPIYLIGVEFIRDCGNIVDLAGSICKIQPDSDIIECHPECSYRGYGFEGWRTNGIMSSEYMTFRKKHMGMSKGIW